MNAFKPKVVITDNRQAYEVRKLWYFNGDKVAMEAYYYIKKLVSDYTIVEWF